jgi:hypothetical protein
MSKDGGFNSKVPVPASKSSIGLNIPKDSGKGMGKAGSPISTPNGPTVTATSKPFGSGTGFKNGKI